MSRDYPRLSVEDFGHHLLTSGDLDPVYIALRRSGWAMSQVHRFLVAYWCLYHCGAASYLSELEGETFWSGLEAAAANMGPAPTGGRWPRGHERRHWRGKQGVGSAIDLRTTYERPEHMVESLMARGSVYKDVAEFAQSHRGFGPWISFKICDMLDRVCLHHVDFSTEAAFNGIFKDPWEAALQLWRLIQFKDRHAKVKAKDEAGIVQGVVEHLRHHFRGHLAPPMNDRPIGVQEIETILCKWKSHMNGHYPLNNDIDEINAGLTEWSNTCQSVRQLQKAMPLRMFLL